VVVYRGQFVSGICSYVSKVLISVLLKLKSVWILGYELDDWGSIPGGGNNGNFSLRRHVQSGYGAHPTYYTLCTGGLPSG
jgi:hypothetical protein